ncbi:transcriptional repressor protein YY1-like [Sarcoptes scabiei]|nr:transcriptional repressor protein YY1-like [Sarcoptes scabiei]
MSVREFFDLFNYRRLKRHDKSYFFLKKRSILMFCLFCIITYLLLYVFRKFSAKNPKQEDLSVQCIDRFLQTYHSEIEESDSSFWVSDSFAQHTLLEPSPTLGSIEPDISEISKNSFVPLVGNGKFAVNLLDTVMDSINERFFIKGRRIVDFPLPFDPIITIGQFGFHSKTAFVARYRKGTVEKITCTNYGGGIISIHETFSAHRLIPILFTQTIRILNPTNTPLILNLARKGWFSKSYGPSKSISISTKDHQDYSMLVAPVQIQKRNSVKSNILTRAIAIAYPSLHNSLEVHPNNRYSFTVNTFINYTQPFQKESDLQAAIPDLKVILRESVKKLINFADTSLQQYHEFSWEHLWSSGFSISHSHAPKIVNGYQINATIYYMLSQRPMILPKKSNSLVENLSNDLFNSVNLETATLNRTYKPDRCYHGHSTFFAPRLWSRLDSIKELHRVIALWFLTLEKQSCDHLIQSSANDVLQAVLLSLVGLRFTPKHLEFHSHPSDLQRSFLARNLLYDEQNAFNISVNINDDNKALILVSLDRKDVNVEYYACDAGCLDAPVHLTSKPIEFPVKLTEPLTPLLYITSDREHLKELKDSIHVKEISEAPPHEHHTLALHRYGHSFGGLSNFFWISIIILIIVFHLFLGKLIYNEYFKWNNLPYERSPYRNIGRYSM